MNTKGAVAFLIVLILSSVAAGIIYFTVLKEDDKDAELPGSTSSQMMELPQGTSAQDSPTGEGEVGTDATGNPEDDKKIQPVFGKVDDSYFDDALFIGDSRTVGLYEYGSIRNADFYASSGLSSYHIFRDALQVEGVGKVTLGELLNKKEYGKIYIMVGINEMEDTLENRMNAYTNSIAKLRELEPNAIIYIQGNLHVTAKKSETDPIFTNQKINDMNEELKKLADNEHIFYIDVNEKFDDENGGLEASITQDGVHPLGKYYAEWSDWIREHAVIE